MIERRGGWRLAAMMALIYAVQGSFWPLLAVHLQDLGLNGRFSGMDLRDPGDGVGDRAPGCRAACR